MNRFRAILICWTKNQRISSLNYIWHVPILRWGNVAYWDRLLTTAMRFAGTLTREVFLQFLDEFLVPGLKPGQIVILDNAKAHKGGWGA
jgi:hypothetical protein